MGGPVLPMLRQHFGLEAAKTGLITSAFPLGMFAAVFFFPILSDRIGRKPVLIISYLGVGTGFLLQSLAVRLNLSFATFLALRVASGAFAGASTVVKAYIADVSDRETLPQVMAYREAAGTLAFIVGPTLGGFLFALAGLESVICASGLMSLVSALLVFALLRGPSSADGPAGAAPSVGGSGASGGSSQASATATAESSKQTAVGSEAAKASGSSDGRRLGASPWVAAYTMMGVSFAYNFGQSFFDGFFILLCAERFGWAPAVLGPLLTCMACLVFANSGFLYPRLVKRFGVVQVAILGLLCVTSGLVLLGDAGTIAAVAASLAFYALGVPIFTPSVPTILASCAPGGRRGFVLGVDSAVNTVARICAPVLLGVVYQWSPLAAFRCAGCMVLMGMGLMLSQQSRLRSFLVERRPPAVA